MGHILATLPAEGRLTFVAVAADTAALEVMLYQVYQVLQNIYKNENLKEENTTVDKHIGKEMK